jgi:hypothetical protein
VNTFLNSRSHLYNFLWSLLLKDIAELGESGFIQATYEWVGHVARIWERNACLDTRNFWGKLLELGLLDGRERQGGEYSLDLENKGCVM